MRCTSNYPFAKPVDMDIFLHSTHKVKKCYNPKIAVLILYDQYPYTFPPIIYAVSKKTYDLSTRPRICVRFLSFFAHHISVVMRT